MPLSSDL
jgi:hypothetical protein